MTAAARRVVRRARPAVARVPFPALCRACGLPEPVAEYRFAPPRRWRMDYAWPAQRVGLEVDGGIWMRGGGRHTRGSGWQKDTEKLNTAAALGYRMVRCTPQHLADGSILEVLRVVLQAEVTRGD